MAHSGYTLIRWAAIDAKVPSDRYVGADRVRRILVALALHAGRDWRTCVGRRGLADELGVDPRTVGRAIGLLAGAGLITATERDGRGLPWWRIWPDHLDLTGGDSTTTGGDSTLGASTTTGGDSTTMSGVLSPPGGGATGGATGGDSTTGDISIGTRTGDGARAHAHTRVREAAGGTPPTEENPEPQRAATTTRSDPTDPADMPVGCTRHPDGTDEPCRACQAAARRFDRNEAAWKASRCKHYSGCGDQIDRSQPEFRLCTRHIALRAAGQ